MAVTTPFWFKQRQGKVEDVGTDLIRVTGPNLKEAFLGIRKGDNGRWSAFVRTGADGPDVHATLPEINSPYEAWEAAFEIFRKQMVI
jgi:hypothetical protein